MAEITTLVNFNFANGEQPVGSLVEDAAGDLFGMAATPSSAATPTEQVFEIAKTVSGYASAPTLLGTFTATRSNLAPNLAIDSSGDLFTQTSVGADASTQVYEIAKSGGAYAAPAIIGNIAGVSAGNLVVDPYGNLIGEVTNSYDEPVIYELEAVGSKYLSLPVTLANLSGPLAFDAAGDLFVGAAEFAGGGIGYTLSNAAIYEIASTQTGYASSPKLLSSFSLGPALLGMSIFVNSLFVDTSGNVFGDVGGTLGGSVFEIPKTGDDYASSPTFLPAASPAYGLQGTFAADANGDLFAAMPGASEYWGRANDDKIIAELRAPDGAHTEDDIITFNGADGLQPNSVLIGPDGALYGTTESGGANGDGVLFRIALLSLSVSGLSVSATGQLTISGKIDVPDSARPVSIYSGDDLVGTATPAANGAWSATLAQPIASGETLLNSVASNAYNQTTSLALDLFYNTNNHWGETTGANGLVYLDNAQVSVTGAGASVYLLGGDDWASLYNTSGDWDSVTGDDGSVILTGAQASIFGGGDRIYFDGPSKSAVSLYATKGNWDKATGDDGALTLVDAQASVFGGSNTIYLDGAADDAASLYSTNGHWDTVYGNGGSVTLNGAQASLLGQGDRVYFAPATHNQVALYDTNGVADSVAGSNGVVILSSAQSSVTGGSNVLYFVGQDDAADLYATSSGWDTVNATGASLTLHAAQASVFGGGDTLHFDGSSSDAASLYNTSGNWDTVFGDDGAVALNGAQASLLGHGDHVYFGAGAHNAVSLYWTYGVDDHVVGSNGSINLASAQADVQGNGDYLYLTGASTAVMTGANENFVFQAAIGEATIRGFVSSDVVQFSSADFANWQTLSGHIAQSGDDVVISYGANDQVTLTDYSASSLTAANFKFA